MSLNNTCENCIHAVVDLNNKELVYKCRRYPPTSFAIPQQSAMGVGIAFITAFPQVSKNDRCGEHIAKLEPLIEKTSVSKILV